MALHRTLSHIVLFTAAVLGASSTAFATEYVLSHSDLLRPCMAAHVQDFKKVQASTGVTIDQLPFQLVASGGCQDSTQVMDVYQMNNGSNVKVDESLKMQKFPTIDACKKALEPAVIKVMDGLVEECKALCAKNKTTWTVDPKMAKMFANRGGWSKTGNTGKYQSASYSKEMMGFCK